MTQADTLLTYLEGATSRLGIEILHDTDLPSYAAINRAVTALRKRGHVINKINWNSASNAVYLLKGPRKPVETDAYGVPTADGEPAVDPTAFDRSEVTGAHGEPIDWEALDHSDDALERTPLEAAEARLRTAERKLAEAKAEEERRWRAFCDADDDDLDALDARVVAQEPEVAAAEKAVERAEVECVNAMGAPARKVRFLVDTAPGPKSVSDLYFANFEGVYYIKAAHARNFARQLGERAWIHRYSAAGDEGPDDLRYHDSEEVSA